MPIDFLYLDSYDYEWNNPSPSQEHHLREIQAAFPRLHENSVVMIDDCALPQGGKGKLAIEYLKERGWKILLEQYQTILIFDPRQTPETTPSDTLKNEPRKNFFIDIKRY
jgi:hypothetical protein